LRDVLQKQCFLSTLILLVRPFKKSAELEFRKDEIRSAPGQKKPFLSIKNGLSQVVAIVLKAVEVQKLSQHWHCSQVCATFYETFPRMLSFRRRHELDGSYEAIVRSISKNDYITENSGFRIVSQMFVKVEKGLQIRKTDLYFLLSQLTARTFELITVVIRK